MGALPVLKGGDLVQGWANTSCAVRGQWTHVFGKEMGFFIPRLGGGNRTPNAWMGAGLAANAHPPARLFHGQHDTGRSRSSHTGRYGGQGLNLHSSDAAMNITMIPLPPYRHTHTQLWGQFPWIR